MDHTKRETFSSRFGLLMTMIGVAVGLGNVWRFPYMVGKFGGAAFVVFYFSAVLLIGIPALMAEWTLGRYTGRGTLGAFEKGGFPGGKYVGIFLFLVVINATAYYTNTIGWVFFHGIAQALEKIGISLSPSLILPPQKGINVISFLLQVLMTGLVIFGSGFVLVKGLKRGIEKISKIIMPSLFIILIILIIRAVTLPGAVEGLKWYLGGFQFKALTGSVMAAAIGQAIFSLSLGGTFMVVYGSYLKKTESIPKNALLTGIGDLMAGLLAGLAIIPAVFAFGQKPDSGPGLIFSTLPKTFLHMPAGWLFALLFFVGLFGAAFLSDMAAFEVLITGITDNSNKRRTSVVWIICCMVFFLALPPMINMKLFLLWDLILGSGMQTVGSLLAVITIVWCVKRSEALKEFALGTGNAFPVFFYWWMRIVIPLVILAVGVYWLLESVFHVNIFKWISKF
jgi:NSS family neurotransmitter:Na+ symporter